VLAGLQAAGRGSAELRRVKRLGSSPHPQEG